MQAAVPAGAGGSSAPIMDPAPAAPAECVKDQVEGSEVLIIGESFYAANSYPKMSLEKIAREAGALNPDESYRQTAVVGTRLANGQIPGQYDRGLMAGPVKLVIMDGGGNDAMGGVQCMDCPRVFEELLEHMGETGVENVIYTRYPEPGVPPDVIPSLKAGLDWLMPMMETVCAASTKPACHWVDLRPVWKPGDCLDGLHPTPSGGEHVAMAIWAKMQEKCLAL
jgi:hypothetical protein